MARKQWLRVAEVRSRSGGDPHEVKTDGEVLGCDCWPWRTCTDRPKRCTHTDEVAPRVNALGGCGAVFRLLRRGIEIEQVTVGTFTGNRRTTPTRATLVDAVENILMRLAAQGPAAGDLWRAEWRVLRADLERIGGTAYVASPVTPADNLPDWLGGRRAIILRD